MVTAPGITMGYDPAGRLTKYDLSGSTLRLAYAGSALIQETNGSNGAILRRYVPGAGTDETVLWYEGASTSDRRWLHADERGSVVAISDGSGNMLVINRYDEYGIPSAGNAGRFQYTGQAWLAELGMYNYKARIYSPTLGRFMQTDPIGYDDGLNWYNYVGSDPINATDPSGLAIYDFCTGSRLCRQDGSGGTVSFGWVTSSLGPSQGGIAARRPGSTTATCDNCGSLGVVGSDRTITVTAPTYTLAYSPGAYFLIASAGAPQSASRGPCEGRTSDLFDSAEYALDFVGTTADGTSLALGGAGLLAAEAPPVAGGLAVGAGAAQAVSLIAGAASAGIKAYRGNYVGAATSLTSSAVGRFGARALGKLAQWSGGSLGGKLARDAQATVASQAIGRLQCPK